MKKTPPKISVILPVYNPGESVRRCLRSLQGQTLSDIEIIFIDDRGSDASMDIIREAANHDPRIRILVNEVNSGAGYSRNRGIEQAEGEYLAFVDPDDSIAEDFLELLWRKAAGQYPDIVKGECALVSMQGKSFWENPLAPLNRKIREGLARQKPLFLLFTKSHWTAIYRRQFLLDADVRYGLTRNSQDSTFLLQACYACRSILFEDRAIYYYSARENSRMRDFSPFRLHEELAACRDMFGFLDSQKVEPDARCRFVNGRIAYLLRLQAAVEMADAKGEAAGFLEEFRQFVSDLPYAEMLAANSFLTDALLQYHANLSTDPYRAQSQPSEIEAYVDVADRWVRFAVANPEIVQKKRNALRNVFLTVLRSNRLNAEHCSPRRRRSVYRRLRKLAEKLPDRKLLTDGCRPLELFLHTGINEYRLKRSVKKSRLYAVCSKMRRFVRKRRFIRKG